MIGRRALLAATAAAWPAIARAAPGKLKVRLGIVTVSSQMALELAVTQGMFAKAGFDVEVHKLASGIQANQALAAGQVDWSAGGIESTITAASAGLAFKPYAMYAKGGDSLGLLARRSSGIRTVADLKGKRIAIVVGTASAQGLSDVLAAHGMTDADVRRVNATFGNMGQMLLSGAVDAMAGLEPFLTATQEKLGANGILLTRFGKYVQGGGFFLIADAWASAHPDRIVPALIGLAEAQKFIREDLARAAKLIAPFLGADPGIIERSSTVLEFTPGIDPFTMRSLRQTSVYLAEHKFVPKPVDIDALMAPALKATAELRQRRPDLSP
jgi:ABC-type nitrate/sulfonate/bicarbonate transport system substrate-binding protein